MIQQLITITPDMARANDDAPAPGRVRVIAKPCPACRAGHVWRLTAGSWALRHSCLAGWSAHPAPAALAALARVAARDARSEVNGPRRSEVDALAGRLAPTLAGAG